MLYGASGQYIKHVIKNQRILGGQTQQIILDSKNLSNGVYFLVLQAEGGTTSTPLIIAK